MGIEQTILKFCIEKGLLLDKEVLEMFNDVGDTETIKILLETIGKRSSQKFITKKFFIENKNLDLVFSGIPFENQKYVEKLKIKLGLNIEILKEYELTHEVDNKIKNIEMLNKFLMI